MRNSQLFNKISEMLIPLPKEGAGIVPPPGIPTTSTTPNNNIKYPAMAKNIFKTALDTEKANQVKTNTILDVARFTRDAKRESRQNELDSNRIRAELAERTSAIQEQSKNYRESQLKEMLKGTILKPSKQAAPGNKVVDFIKGIITPFDEETGREGIASGYIRREAAITHPGLARTMEDELRQRISTFQAGKQAELAATASETKFQQRLKEAGYKSSIDLYNDVLMQTESAKNKKAETILEYKLKEDLAGVVAQAKATGQNKFNYSAVRNSIFTALVEDNEILPDKEKKNIDKLSGIADDLARRSSKVAKGMGITIELPITKDATGVGDFVEEKRNAERWLQMNPSDTEKIKVDEVRRFYGL